MKSTSQTTDDAHEMGYHRSSPLRRSTDHSCVLDYDREANTCRIKFCDPMVEDALESKAEAIRGLRDTMATLRWELMCDQPVLHRADITPEQLRKEMYRVVGGGFMYQNMVMKYPEINLFL